MSKFSNYAENIAFNAVFRNVSYTSPVTVYLALFTTDPTDANSGTEVSTSGTAYARQAITFGAPTNGLGANSAQILFPTATAPWGTISHVGIYDAATAGNLLFHAPLAVPKSITTDEAFDVNAGNLSVQITTAASNFLKNAIFNMFLRNVTYTSPATVYLALYTTATDDAGGGTEVAAGGYARQATAFGAPTNGSGQNSGTVLFGPASADWGTVTHGGYRDASSGGNLLTHGPLGASKAIATNDSLRFLASTLTVTID